jgi:hypothetical protein
MGSTKMCLVGHHQTHPYVGGMIVHYRYHINLLWFHVVAHWSDHQLIGKKKKAILLEIKFRLNENIE